MKNISFTLFTLIFACNIAAQPITAHKPTAAIIAYCEHLIEQNMIGIEQLQRIVHANSATLTNPLSAQDAAHNHAAHIHYTTLNSMITAAQKTIIDYDAISAWAHYRINELHQEEMIRHTIHTKTHHVHHMFEFVPLKPGTYTSAVNQQTFIISEGAELQATPVTQYQWFVIMGYNPSHFTQGPAQEHISVNDHAHVTIHADYPVESISFKEIQAFITKLNSIDTLCTYALPSINEYEAALQITGTTGLECIEQMRPCCNNQQPYCVTSPPYHTVGNERMWSLIGNVWQYTRDSLELNKDFSPAHMITSHLVFGGSYATEKIPSATSTLEELIRPVISPESRSSHIGLRLMRYPKKVPVVSKKYPQDAFTWKPETVARDNGWQTVHIPEQHPWLNSLLRVTEKLFAPATISYPSSHTILMLLDDRLRFMFDHPDLYSFTTRNMLKVLHRKGDPSDLLTMTSLDLTQTMDKYTIVDLTPLSYMPQLEYLSLSFNYIHDITALAHVHLKTLDLSYNYIHDISPLLSLTNLQELYLEYNAISDLTPLAHLTQLKDVWINNNHHTPADVRWLKDKLPATRIIDTV